MGIAHKRPLCDVYRHLIDIYLFISIFNFNTLLISVENSVENRRRRRPRLAATKRASAARCRPQAAVRAALGPKRLAHKARERKEKKRVRRKRAPGPFVLRSRSVVACHRRSSALLFLSPIRYPRFSMASASASVPQTNGVSDTSDYVGKGRCGDGWGRRPLETKQHKRRARDRPRAHHVCVRVCVCVCVCVCARVYVCACVRVRV